MTELTVTTSQPAQFLDITGEVQQAVSAAGVKDGLCTVFIPHTTAGITIQENADPDVVTDMLYALDKAVPLRDPHYRHAEGNTAAHVKASLLGSSVNVLVQAGRLRLGTWQGIYFCEFDGPRTRQVLVTIQ
ncbi:MAG: secondary thiamine-phosphate synthase enzyme YjbQ [Verrucomicrobiota bacterium]